VILCRHSVGLIGLLITLAACGGELAPSPNESGAPQQGEPASGTSAAGTSAPIASEPTPPPPPPPPPVRLPSAPIDGSFTVDPASTPTLVLPALSPSQLTNCAKTPYDSVPSTNAQAIWSAAPALANQLASGRLLGNHHFSRITAGGGDWLLVETWNPRQSGSQGYVRIHKQSREVVEVFPIGAVEPGSPVSATYAEGSFYLLREFAKRSSELWTASLSNPGATKAVTLPFSGYATMVSKPSGLYLNPLYSGALYRYASGAVTYALRVSVPLPIVFDVAPDGTVFYATDSEIRRSDSSIPLVTGGVSVASIAVAADRGEVYFTLGEGARTSLHRLTTQGLTRIIDMRETLPQPTTQALHVASIVEGDVLLRASCQDDADAPHEAPLRVNLAQKKATWMTTVTGYPYTADYAAITRDQEAQFDAARGVFFLRR
jgi:hypothetical protein